MCNKKQKMRVESFTHNRSRVTKVIENINIRVALRLNTAIQQKPKHFKEQYLSQ
jgi:hypothetical protein